MKLEVGKCYLTRDGRKAYVAAIGNPFDSNFQYPAIGFVEGEGYCSWTADGIYMLSDCIRQYDLIAEWREPAIATGTVFLYRNCYGKVEVSTSKYAATCNNKPDLIGQKEITITEGEGLGSQP